MDDDDKTYWFVPRRYGYGATPATWQGWAITIAFILFALGVVLRLKDDPLVQMAILLPAIAVLIVITARKTRGGWRWRWGEKD